MPAKDVRGSGPYETSESRRFSQGHRTGNAGAFRPVTTGMNKLLNRSRRPALVVAAFAALSLAAFASAPAQEKAAADGFTPLLNGKDMSGWKFKDPSGAAAWKLVAGAKLDPADSAKLASEGEFQGGKDPVLLRGPFDHGSDVYTEAEAGDVELYVDLMVPKNSNSGVYLMGQYEIQVFDSFGKDKVGPGDIGGIYNTKAPDTNAAKAPGEWQTLHIVFRAPRFGADGKKTENAKFVLVELNGTKIHENVEAPKATGGELPGGEKAKGPLLFQGDHGIVAYRNVKWKPLGN